jgi:hypothetical protein
MTNMATAARPKRTVAPKATTKVEVPTTPAPAKVSFLARAKVTVVKTARRVVAIVKTTAKAVVARVKPIAKRAWAIALRPYLGGVLAGAALGTVIIGAFVAPATTIATLLVGGLVFVGLARGVRALEESDSRAAKVALDILEIVGQALRALAYAGAAVLAVAMASVSWTFAVFSVLLLVLAYLDVRGAGTIAFLAWCVLSGSWGFGLLWLMWRGAARLTLSRSQPVAVDVPEYSEIRREPVEHAHVLRRDYVAVGAEEVADLIVPEPSWEETYENATACDACGTTKGAARIRSNAVPFVTVGSPNFGKPHEASDAMLCSSCYEAECEDNAIALTGVSLKKVSTNVVLNAVGREALPEVAASKADVTQVFWAVTAWWRDRRSNHHERQWDCFHDGKVVATVVYDHSRKVYRASALGKFLGTKTAPGAAKRLSTDAIFDEGNAVTRMVEALAPEAVAESAS